MFTRLLTYLALPLVLLASNSSGISAPQMAETKQQGQSGTLEKMTIASGNVAIDLNLDRLNGITKGNGDHHHQQSLRFQIGVNSFFTILVFNDTLRGPQPSSMALVPGSVANLPGTLQASLGQLSLEKLQSDAAFDLAVRNQKTGFTFLNVTGHQYEYEAASRSLRINDGKLLISEEFAKALGRPADAGTNIGTISVSATMYDIEVSTLVNGTVQSAVLPAQNERGPNAPNVVQGPDVIVGEIISVEEGGSEGSDVGLGVGTTSCNNGDQPLNWFALPQVDHPVIPQNLYRMSRGPNHDERFEQIGQSWLKHSFTALEDNACGFGCNTSGCATGTHLCVGCSDPYSANLNYSQPGLGSRAWVNPFTGAYPSNSRDHTGHTHTNTSHRLLVSLFDLIPVGDNVGASYLAEAQYVTPHEYAWCQTHPGQCNMYNNASYRQFSVSVSSQVVFFPVGSTVQMSPAINAWTGATINRIEPVPGSDGFGLLGYKVTNPSAGVWHYEYALYNQNLDRAMRSFTVPLGSGITVSGIGFHAPVNHPGFPNDGTQGDMGFTNTPWTVTQNANALTWSTETFAQNPNANAIRWGTLYNFRFDSNRPPRATNATIGFFKTGEPMTIAFQAPSPDPTTSRCPECSRDR